jgi:sporulation protein YlmC with PRC-barrel domain
MIRTLLTTTALVALLGTGALAQDAAPAAAAMATQPFDLEAGYTSADTDNLATRILGQPIYTSAAADAENIGEVNDLVFDESGNIRAVIVGVGGFLGVGEKNVAIDFGQLQWVPAEDNTERFVLETTKEALTAAPAFEFIEDEPATDTAATTAPVDPNAPADPVDATVTETAATPDAEMAPEAGAEDQAAVAIQQPDATATPGTVYDPSAMTDLDEAVLTADELQGSGVIGPDGTQIAEVGDIVLTEDGQVDAVLIDFGGFLGIGEKRIAVGMDGLDFRTDENGGRFLFLNVTREQLDAAPAYDEATYATDRMTQRMVVSVAQ